MQYKKQKIHIVQLVTPNIDSYAKYSINSFFQYCTKHDIRYSVQRNKTVEDMHINWTKIDVLKNMLTLDQDADIVILVDADTIVLNPEFQLSNFILNHQSFGKHIMMPQDDRTRPWKRKRPNAGFISVTNEQNGREIIEFWLHAAKNQCKHLSDRHPRNQLVYWNCVMPKYESRQVVLPLKYFKKGSDDAFIHHFMRSSIVSRSKRMAKVHSEIYGSLDLYAIENKLSQNQNGLLNLVE
jgi:hypothetical protein